MRRIPVVVLAGGVGERIRVLTGGRPKALLGLAGRYLVEYVLDNVAELGLTEVYVVVGNPRDFEDVAVKYGRRLRLELVQQGKPGVEGAVESVRGAVGGDFLLVYGDVVAPVDMYRELLDLAAAGEYGVVLVPEEELEQYTVARLRDPTTVEEFSATVEPGAVGYYAVGGAYLLPGEFLEYVGAYGSLTDALNAVNRRFRLRPCIWGGWWVDVEYPWDLLRATLYVLDRLDRAVISGSARVARTATVEGAVIIDEDAEVDHYAVIKGPAYIGRNCYIGSYTLVRNYVSLEGDNVVGSYAEVVWSSIQRGATIGSRSYIGFSVMGEGSTVEPGVVTLNVVPERVKVSRPVRVERRGREYVKLGAVVGRGARVRAYTVLKPCEVVE
jgi:glucose-1-phosphate thymidylyltransferase